MSAKIPEYSLPLSTPAGLGETIRRRRLVSHVILAAAATAFAALAFVYQRDYSRVVKLPVGVVALFLTGVWLRSETVLSQLIAKVKELKFEEAQDSSDHLEPVSPDGSLEI